MKRKLLFANLALLALSVAGGVHLRREWIAARAREQAVLRKRIQATPPPPMTPLPANEPVKAVDYNDIAQKMLFSKDRNPVVVVEPPPALICPTRRPRNGFSDSSPRVSVTRTRGGHTSMRPAGSRASARKGAANARGGEAAACRRLHR